MSTTGESGALEPRPGGAGLVRSGAELVELSERFFRGIFVACVLFVGFSCLAALVLLPWRDSDAGYTTPTVPVVGALLLATPVAVARAQHLHRALLHSVAAQSLLVALAAVLVCYPLRSELWWPSCALVMLLATVVGVQRGLLAALLVLVANLAAHLVAGDLDETPAVSVIGLWIGFGFWTAAFALIPDRLTAYVLRLNALHGAAAAGERAPLRVRATVIGDEPAAHPPAEEGALRRLTARQLQVVALLADGLRYEEVAACLAISRRQVERHVRLACDRLGVRTTAQLVARAVALGLVPGDAR